MTESIFTAIGACAVFAIPCVVVAAIDYSNAEKRRKERELALIREMELETLKYETWAQAEQYYKTCQNESMKNSLKRNGQQVDKEIARYAG
ncbi:TPA: hypothetical protein U2B50_000752 [Streptococcus suis]|nr:hypothetical protein [Streptococcus suis]